MPASSLLMIRPSAFGYNPETAESNVFQKQSHLSAGLLQEKALSEFNSFHKKLTDAGINVFVFDDLNKETPDSVFPNNWVSFHDDGTVVLYPMLSPIRRKERRTDILESLRKDFKITRIIDLTHHEEEGKFLEGTGSIVFDHKNKVAFAALSSRTDKNLFVDLCSELDFEPVFFTAKDQDGVPVYHTNVVMALSENIAIICTDSIQNSGEKKQVLEKLRVPGRIVLEISFHQMNSFAGNVLWVQNSGGIKIMVISETAFNSLNERQKTAIMSSAEVVTPGIETIETCGGGSVRCMLAEIFLPSV